MGRKPSLFIDIDGVLSLWGFAQADPPPGAWTLVDGIAHFLSAEAAETLRGVQSDFACVWASGWEEKANEYLPHALGLGPWPYLELDRRTRPGTSVAAHWKLGAVEAHAAGGALAWIDDDVDDGVRAWVAARNVPTLLIQPDPARGLTAGDGERLRRFAAEAAAAA
ncbi:MAG TPA: hypothetical protein VFZ89_00520 [Solirubrobacteraceae bacterium]